MPKSAAEILGLKLDGAEESKVWTASGPIMAKRAVVGITIHLTHDKKTIRAPFNILDINDYEPPVMLGRAGFFESFHISFSEKEKRFTLKPMK
jgi:hypothetical protein